MMILEEEIRLELKWRSADFSGVAPRAVKIEVESGSDSKQ